MEKIRKENKYKKISKKAPKMRILKKEVVVKNRMTKMDKENRENRETLKMKSRRSKMRNRR